MTRATARQMEQGIEALRKLAAAPNEPAWWAGALNRRATVEQWMFDAARGKRPMPSADELRAWAIKLGTPEPGEPAGSLQGKISDEQIEVMRQWFVENQGCWFASSTLRAVLCAAGVALPDGAKR